MPGPLSNIRILSLAEQLPGPYATLLLADMGADVILVERPQGGDPSRAFPDFFKSLGRNKRSVCLDLKLESDKGKLCDLVKTADILLEGFKPGTMTKLGLGYSALAEINPRLIYASISGFGHSGPYMSRPAHDISIQSVAGLVPDTPETELNAFPFADLSGAMFAALGVVAALNGRKETGKGTWIDVSMADGLVSWLTFAAGPKANAGHDIDVAEEPGYGRFRCSDGRALTLSIAHEDHFWRTLCDVLSLDEDLKSLKHRERVKQADALTAIIQDAIARKPLEYWQNEFDKKGVPWGPVNSVQHVLEDPHFKSRNMFDKMAGQNGAMFNYVNQPLKFSNFETNVEHASPELGEHTSEVFDALHH